LPKKYGISRTTICKWVAIHQGIYNLPLTEKQKRYSTSSMNSSPKKSSSHDQSVEELQQKIAALEKQLEWEKLRLEALDTMINIAEKDLNIQIRKKARCPTVKAIKEVHSNISVQQTCKLLDYSAQAYHKHNKAGLAFYAGAVFFN
jgi:hypothetical protein